jgi:uncharacterized membrane protein (UPF0136 family)
VGVVCGGLSAFIALYNWSIVESLLDESLIAASGAAVGWGLIVCSLASLSLVLASLIGLVERRKEMPAFVSD